jgi:hypothetical protein
MKMSLLFLCICITIALTTGPVVSAEIGGAQEKIGGITTAVSNIVFKCDGKIVQGEIKPEEKNVEKTQEEAFKKPKPFIQWYCRTQPKVQDAFTNMHIPPMKEPYSLTTINKLGIQINAVASKEMNKNCSCTFDPNNKQTNKPLIACTCSGEYKGETTQKPK